MPFQKFVVRIVVAGLVLVVLVKLLLDCYSNSEDGKVVYFVDCGDYDVTTLSEGDQFGTRNSVTDQVFGKDAKTEYTWGIVDNTEPSEKHGNAEKGVFTNHTWANEQISGDGVAKEVSNRYTKDQFEDSIDRHLEYDFELSAGTYIIETAFVNPWNVSSPVQIKANTTILCESLEIPQNDCKVTSNTITLEKDEIIKLRAEAKDALCINMAYIIIKGEKPSSDDNNNDQNKPDDKPDQKPDDSENNQKPSDQPGNNGNNSNNSGNGISSGNGSVSNTNTGNNNASNNTRTNNEAENNNTSTQNPTVTTEEKPDGTIITTTIEKQQNGMIKTTIVEEKPDGTKIESVKEEKTDGSSVETKNVTSLDNSVVLQAVIKTDTAGSASTDAIILTGIAKAGKITVAENLLKSIIENNKVESLVVEISKQTITSTVQGKANTIVNISIPKVDEVYPDKIVLTRDAVVAAKEIKKGLKVKIESKSDDNYIVTIPAKQLAKVKASLENLDISVKVDSASNLVNKKKALVNVVTTSKGNQKKTGVISVAENMAENVGFKISVPVEKADIAGNSIVYIYKYNTGTGKLEEVANSKTKVTADGMITMEAISNTDYIISAKKLSGKNVETIKEMIKVALTKNSVKAGKNVKVKLSLPDTVSKSKKFAAEKANITYKSGNKKIASVSSKGVIKTKKKGKVVITTIIKLESGQKITKENKITIK